MMIVGKWELIQQVPPFRTFLNCPLKVSYRESDLTANPESRVFYLS